METCTDIPDSLILLTQSNSVTLIISLLPTKMKVPVQPPTKKTTRTFVLNSVNLLRKVCLWVIGRFIVVPFILLGKSKPNNIDRITEITLNTFN